MDEDVLVPAGGVDARRLVAELRACDRELRLGEARKLLLAARLADCYGYVPGVVGPGGEVLRDTYEGCPAVAEFAAVELGAALGIGEGRAWELLEDAVGLRHRFPRVWESVQAGVVWAWQARRIVARSGGLSLQECRRLDGEVAVVLPRMVFSRVLRLVEGRVAALTQSPGMPDRFVRVVARDADGAEVFARLNPADARRLDRTVSGLAKILAQGGNTGDVEQRRAVALGVLATPARALQLQVASLLDADEPAGAEEPSRVESATASLGGLDSQAVSPELARAVMAIDPERLRPTSELHVHLTPETLASWTKGPVAGGVARCEELGPVLRDQLVELLGHDRVTVRPVVIPLELEPQDRYEARPLLCHAVMACHSVDAFPYGRVRARCCDLDHITPYRAGVGGQTRLDNLQPLSRKTHRVKTHAGWVVTPDPNRPFTRIWTSPLGYVYRVGPEGTTLLAEPAAAATPVARPAIGAERSPATAATPTPQPSTAPQPSPAAQPAA